VFELPEGLSYEDASLIEPLSCCILGLNTAGLTDVENVVIYGAGPVGLMIYKLLIQSGVRSVAIGDVSEYRNTFSRRFGAEIVFDPSNKDDKERVLRSSMTHGPGLVVVATASVAALEDAMQMVARGGRVLLFGAPRRGATGTVDLAHFFLNGTSVVTSYASSEKETLEATSLLAEGSISLSELVTHRFPLAASEQAFAAAAQQHCMKALITN
jgi:L-iditol 2-dehydrogenase